LNELISNVKLDSPNGNIRVKVSIRERLEPYPNGNRLYYSVSFKGKEIIVDSPLGLDFKNMPPLAKDLKIVDQEMEAIKETWKNPFGKNRIVLNHCNEMRLWFEEKNPPGRKLGLVLRAYNDGVAFRYFLPSQPAIRKFKLTSERSEFHFAYNHTVWAADYGDFVSPQEKEFERIRLSQITPSSIIGLPLLVRISESCWVAITEANLTDWAGMYLTSTGTKPTSLVTTLSPRLDEPGVLVCAETPHYSPWRVIMTGEKPGDLIESNIILNLNEPCAFKDVSWIKPGKAAWNWWCGDYIPDATFDVGLNNESVKYFIQFASEMGFEYFILDEGWYGEPGAPNSDITIPVPELNMEELLAFARKRNVRIILWLYWGDVERQMDEAFPLYEEWKIAGVKIDFMNRDDQEMVNFYHRVAKKAAEHHLIVDFHGAYKPTGKRRTYPNIITREGVLGNEYNRISNRVTPQHNVTLPFTRMLAGPMDFTPGGFRHATKETFKPRERGPFVMGTRCHQLAMLIVYESPLQVLCDSPFNYRGQVGVDFLRIVPTTWDETRVIHGEVAEYIVIARRSGNDWFIGGMTNWTERTLEIPLDFLSGGEYHAKIYYDSADANDYPEHARVEEKKITAKDVLIAEMASGGGFVAHLHPC